MHPDSQTLNLTQKAVLLIGLIERMVQDKKYLIRRQTEIWHLQIKTEERSNVTSLTLRYKFSTVQV